MSDHLDLIASLETELPPCTLAYLPPSRRYLIVGTYDLQRETGSRSGSLDIYDTLNGVNRTKAGSVESKDSSILDIRFSPHDPSKLVSAHSTGYFSVWKVTETVDHGPQLILQERVQVAEPEILVLSICISPVESGLVCTTLSSGNFVLSRVSSLGSVKTSAVLSSVQAHTLEAWTASFKTDGTEIYTGGDDAQFTNYNVSDPESPFLIQQDRKIHTAGVTAILPRRSDESTIFTGSYDENLRVLEKFGNRWISKSGEIGLGGGVWRLIPNGVSEDLILVCCMHGGARIVKGTGEIVVVATINKIHESMVYGGDWGQTGTLATCSFYDKRLCIWKLP
ncbi:WD40-repeat-containing domain protein [Lipomyces oligophaga]|uniref:WD40-repeat-containing domain protein n=1 Tax=Lipomyces oligophaga TaxID=45792 RepID=UPI0034CDED3A